MINPGLLNGPFLPIYGSISIIILFVYGHFPFKNIALDFIIFSILVTFLEYVSATLAENYFKVRLWEYDDHRFNIKGRVCLRFFLYWGCYVTVFLYLIHPAVYRFYETCSLKRYTMLFMVLNAVILLDFLVSVQAMKRFVTTLHLFIEEYLNLDNKEIENYFYQRRRQFKAFSALRKYTDFKLKKKLESRITKQLSQIQTYFNDKLFSHKPDETEYRLIIDEILSNDEFKLLSRFFHHDSSILTHAKKVAYASYKISKYLGFDYISTTRGALLHDFFLYDWRKNEGRPYEGGMHGFKHPKHALMNAEKHFKLNDIEKDIILKHMWPLTIVPPKYKESILVSFIDKYISSKETISAVRNNLK